MRILICSDGMPAADSATRLGGRLAGPLQAETTLLGIAEKRGDEGALRDALNAQSQSLRVHGVTPEIVVRASFALAAKNSLRKRFNLPASSPRPWERRLLSCISWLNRQRSTPTSSVWKRISIDYWNPNRNWE